MGGERGRQSGRALRTTAAVAEALGRQHGSRTAEQPTDLGCPDCHGVLTVEALGNQGYLTFRCRVGHTFSAESLLTAKEDQLEQSLWTIIEVVEEIVQLYLALSADDRAAGRHDLADARESRAKRARDHLAVLRSLEAREGPSPPSSRQRGTNV